MNKILIPVLVIFLIVIFYSFSNPTQIGENVEQTVTCSTHKDCEKFNVAISGNSQFFACFSGKCEVAQIGTCYEPKDCIGQPLVVIQCLGQWACEKEQAAESGRCNWQCIQG